MTGSSITGPALSSTSISMVLTSPTLVALGLVLAVVGWGERRRRRRLAVELDLVDRLPTLVDGMVHVMRSGCSLRQACVAIESLDPVLATDRFSTLLSGLRARRRLVDAVQAQLAEGDQHPAVRLVGVTLATLAENGGPAGPALQRLRHTLAGLRDGRRRARAEAAQATASAGLLALAPALFVVAVSALDRSAAGLYFTEALGAVCLIAAIGLSTLGWRWMQHIISRSERAAW